MTLIIGKISNIDNLHDFTYNVIKLIFYIDLLLLQYLQTKPFKIIYPCTIILINRF